MTALRGAIRPIRTGVLGLGLVLTTFVPTGTPQVLTAQQNIPIPGAPTPQVQTAQPNIPIPGAPTPQVQTGPATQQSVNELKALVLDFKKEIVRVEDKLDKHIKESGGYRPAEGRPQPPKRVA